MPPLATTGTVPDPARTNYTSKPFWVPSANFGTSQIRTAPPLR